MDGADTRNEIHGFVTAARCGIYRLVQRADFYERNL